MKENGMKHQNTCTLDKSLRISIACEMLYIMAFRERRKTSSLLLALLIGCLQLLYDWGGTGSAIDRSLGYLYGRVIDTIIITSLAFCFIYLVPLKIACQRVYRLARNDKCGDSSLELEVNSNGVTVTGKRARINVFFQEIDEVIFGQVGCYFFSGREVALCCPLAIVDTNLLSSVMPDSVKFSEWRGKKLLNWPRFS